MSKLGLLLPAVIDWQNTDTETPLQALKERLAISLTPFVDTEGLDIEDQLFGLQTGLTPTITPILDIGTAEALAATGFLIGSGVAAGIAAFGLGNAIVAEITKANLALQNAGIVSGQQWGAGFNTGATPFLGNIVNIVISQALGQIARNSSRTGAN